MSNKPENTSASKRNWILLALITLAIVIGIILATQQNKTVVPQATFTTMLVQAATSTVEKTSGMADVVSVEEAVQYQKDGAFILDVREQDEWNAGHIDGATLIPLGQLADRVKEVPTDVTVVVVCRSGHRSAQGRDVLRNAGLTNVTSMAGGMNAWISAGNPVVTGE